MLRPRPARGTSEASCRITRRNCFEQATPGSLLRQRHRYSGVRHPRYPWCRTWGTASGRPPQWITPILGAYSLCQLLAAPFWGRLSDRYGRRPILMTEPCGRVSFPTSCWGCATTSVAGRLARARWLHGRQSRSCVCLCVRCERAAKSCQVPGHDRRGPSVSASRWGRRRRASLPATTSARRTCRAGGSVGVLQPVAIGARCCSCLPESNTRHPGAARRHARVPSALRLAAASGRALRFIACAALLVTSSQSMLESIFAIWALDKFGFGPRTVGLLLFCLPRSRARRRAGWCGAGAARGRAASGHRSASSPTSLAWCWSARLRTGWRPPWALALCGVGTGCFSPSASALASKQSSDHDRGAVMGTYQSSSSLARVIGPFVAGPVYARIRAAALPIFSGRLRGPTGGVVRVACARPQSSISVSKIDTA